MLGVYEVEQPLFAVKCNSLSLSSCYHQLFRLSVTRLTWLITILTLLIHWIYFSSIYLYVLCHSCWLWACGTAQFHTLSVSQAQVQQQSLAPESVLIEELRRFYLPQCLINWSPTWNSPDFLGSWVCKLIVKWSWDGVRSREGMVTVFLVMHASGFSNFIMGSIIWILSSCETEEFVTWCSTAGDIGLWMCHSLCPSFITSSNNFRPILKYKSNSF